MFSLRTLVLSLFLYTPLICTAQSTSKNTAVVAPAALSVNAAGPACLPGTFSTSLSDDRRALTMILDQAFNTLDENSRTASNSTNCLTNFEVELPRNTSTVVTVSVRGFDNIGNSSTGEIGITFLLDGTWVDAKYFTFQGGNSSDFLYSYNWTYVPGYSAQASQDNPKQKLGIYTTTFISGGNGDSSMVTLDTVDVALNPV